MVTLVKHDLEFMLRQIKISEAHSAGTPLQQIYVDAAGNVVSSDTPGATLALSNPLVPYGLRTVDGSLNNLGEGRELWGASNQPFISLLPTQYRDEGDDQIVFGTGQNTVTIGNNNYAVEGNVADADPRIISNLVADQTVKNYAAVSASLKHAGLTGTDFTAALNDVMGRADLADRAQALSSYGVEVEAVVDGAKTFYNITLPNVAPDEGLSAPYNSWFTLFGQFFDHGLDLVNKNSASGTVYIPLQPDDPLYQAGSPTNFMALTRIDQDAPNNLTTPFVDQNQTYTSHASHQVFLREYQMVEGVPVPTGRLLGGERGLATWGDVKEQAREMLGIELTDMDIVLGVPMVHADAYGNFIPGPDGFPQLVASIAPDGTPSFVPRPGAGELIGTTAAVRIPNKFLDDIAHNAVPVVTGGNLMADADDVAGTTNLATGPRGNLLEYDNELLDAHYITGDGRGNENIGLSAVHHVFHSEHNHLVDQVKQVVLASGDLNFLNEWLTVPVSTMPDSVDGLSWNGERLFHAARFTTEMQYQHLVFEEFGRKVQPDIDVFVFNPSMDINPAIFAEFAHVVYRFGHSMLNQTVDQINANGTTNHLDLFKAFLNPLAFGGEGISHDLAAGAIVRGMTAQVGNEIDEFITHVLRNQLVGIPLDLAALNIARAREAGIPSLNAARREFKEVANGDTQLNPYTSWADFAVNLKNPASIVNFIAAYGTHSSIVGTADEKREAAMKLVFGGAGSPADRLDFLNARNAYAGGNLGGLENVDLWIGGLAEKKMAFGGMLGSTFSFIFELQMENLQNGDRFYYLSRVQGLNLLNELENNSFAKMVMNNTDLGDQDYALPADIFSVPDHVLYIDHAKQMTFTGKDDPTHDDPVLEAMGSLVERGENYIRYNGFDHVVIGGTDGNDTIVAGGGDDAVWGFDGDDRIEAGYGVDKVHGGAGDDIITNDGTDIGETDMLHGDDGNDVIHGGSGLALLFGGSGSDAIITGPDGKEAFGGTGNDFILGGEGGDFLLGNEGDDWIEAGNGFDTTAGDNSELFFNSSIIGHDVMFAGPNEHDFDAESGDDIMVQGESVIRNEGMWGFDWSIYKGVTFGADADLTRRIFTTEQQDILRNRFDQVEGLSGWKHNDLLRGDNRSSLNPIEDGGPDGLRMENNELTQAGVDRITGLRQLLGNLIEDAPGGNPEAVIAFDVGNILLGGGGSDTIEGRGGNDVIDGDAWLNVRIHVDMRGQAPNFSVDSLVQIQNQLLNGTINPSQLSIVREILSTNNPGDFDVAVYSDLKANYDVTLQADGSWIVAHNRGTLADGTDYVRNVERLVFADGILDAPNGAVSVNDTTPTQGGALTALVVDPNSVAGTPVYTWQAEIAPGVWQTVGSGVSFTPGETAVGLRLRVNATYTDALGGPENVTSAPTAVVGRFFTGTDTADTPVLTAGADIAFGAGGTDVLEGGAGDDTLDGGAGNDLLDGETGADSMAGGIGNDRYVVDNAGDVVVELAAQGTDTVLTSLSTYQIGANVEHLTYTGTVSFVATGNELSNMIRASESADTLTGGDGDDSLFGLAGDDLLLGGNGNDNLVGAAGNDVLVGGAGNDTLNGGGGQDTFMFGAGFGNDTIQLFGHSPGGNQDKLDVSGLGITAANFAAAVQISSVGVDTLLNFGGGSVTLLGVSVATITADDFIFA